jgi:protein-S-isoprenylcysteine O-methyltransferase Ste14
LLGNFSQVIYLSGLIIGSIIRGIYTSPSKKSKISVQHQVPFEKLLLFFNALGLLFLPLIFLFTPWIKFADFQAPQWLGWIGTLTFTTALWLLWRSHADLGQNWTALVQIKTDHQLVTGGVYAFVRHPMYTAHLLWGIAQGLLLHNWIAGWSLLLTFLPLYFFRVGREERMLRSHFGESYQHYLKKTPCIIPGIKVVLNFLFGKRAA